MNNSIEIEKGLKSITDLTYDQVKCIFFNILEHSNVLVSNRVTETFFDNALITSISAITDPDVDSMVDFLVSRFSACIYRFEVKIDIKKIFACLLVSCILLELDVIHSFISELEDQLNQRKYADSNNKKSLKIIEDFIFLVREIFIKKIKTRPTDEKL